MVLTTKFDEIRRCPAEIYHKYLKLSFGMLFQHATIVLVLSSSDRKWILRNIFMILSVHCMYSNQFPLKRIAGTSMQNFQFPIIRTEFCKYYREYYVNLSGSNGSMQHRFGIHEKQMRLFRKSKLKTHLK